MYCSFQWWVDHSFSDIAGARITTNAECGAQLLTILTFLVSLAEGAFWTLIAYTLFQCFASKTEITASRAQYQLIFINPTDSFSDWWNLLSTGWSWRKHKSKTFWTLIGLSGVPLLSFLGFSAAHIAVSRVTLPSYEANRYPITGGTCGLVNVDNSQLDGRLVWRNHIVNDTKLAQSYKNTCYHTPTSQLSCSSFVKQELSYSAAMVDCPWDEHLCVTEKAYQLDTGWIDSHEDLGINARAGDRVQARIVSTCSVLNYDDYYVKSADPTSAANDSLHSFYFGTPAEIAPQGNSGLHNGYSLTFQQSDAATRGQGASYVIGVLQFVPNTNASGPPAAMNRPDGDLTLVFMSAASMAYARPNKDPFFRANKLGTIFEGQQIYLADNPVQIMACFDQAQFRNPSMGQETKIGSIESQIPSIYGLGFNHAQNATAKRIAGAFYQSATVLMSVGGLNSAALAASGASWANISPGLPDNQWQIEISGWFDTGLAKIQNYMLEYVVNSWTKYAQAAGHIVIQDPSALHEGDEDAFVKQCSTQLVRGVATSQTFSALGVGIIAVTAPLLVILALTLGRIVRRFGSRHAKTWDLTYRKQNVLRMALESRGYDGWIETHQEIPIRPNDFADIPPPAWHDGHLDIPSTGRRGAYSPPGYAQVRETDDEEPKFEEGGNTRTSVHEYTPWRR